MSQFQNLQIEVPGGAPSEEASPSSARIHADGRVEGLGGARYNTASMLDEASGILDSARTSAGSPVVGRSIRGTDIVRTPDGFEMEARTAVRLGYLDGDERTGYREKGESQAAPATQSVQQAQPKPDPAATAKAELEAMVGRDGALKAMLDVQLKGRVDPAHGAKAPEVQERAIAVASRMVEHQDAALREMGAEPESFRKWADRNAGAELRNATREHYLTGDASAYVGLVDRYFRNALPSEAAIKAAGLETFTTRDGRLMVKLPNGLTTSVAAAAKQGLI